MSWLDLTDAVNAQTSEVFGELCVYWPKNMPSFEIRGIFDEPYFAVKTGGQVEVQDTAPRLAVRLSEFAGLEPDSGDRVEVRAKVYSVIESHPDGQGGAKLLLRLEAQGGGFYA